MVGPMLPNSKMASASSGSVKELWKVKSSNLKRLILLSDPARWPATPAHPCTALTHRGLSSQIFESRLYCVLNECMCGTPKLVSETR